MVRSYTSLWQFGPNSPDAAILLDNCCSFAYEVHLRRRALGSSQGSPVERREFIGELKAAAAALEDLGRSPELAAPARQLSSLASRLLDAGAEERLLLEQVVTCLFEAGLLVQLSAVPGDPPPRALIKRLDRLMREARHLAAAVQAD